MKKKIIKFSILLFCIIFLFYIAFKIFTINNGKVLGIAPVSSESEIILYREFYSNIKNKFFDTYYSDWIIYQTSGENVWKVKLQGNIISIGNNHGVVVSNNKIFVKYQVKFEEKMLLKLICLDIKTGRLQWDKKIDIGEKSFISPLYSDLEYCSNKVIVFISPEYGEFSKFIVVDENLGDIDYISDDMFFTFTYFIQRNSLMIYSVDYLNKKIIEYDLNKEIVVDNKSRNFHVFKFDNYLYTSSKTSLYREKFDNENSNRTEIFNIDKIGEFLNKDLSDSHLVIRNIVKQDNLLYVQIMFDKSFILIYDMKEQKFIQYLENRYLLRHDDRRVVGEYMLSHDDVEKNNIINYRLELNKYDSSKNKRFYIISNYDFSKDFVEFSSESIKLIAHYDNNYLFYNYSKKRFIYYNFDNGKYVKNEYRLIYNKKEDLYIEYVRFSVLNDCVYLHSTSFSSSYLKNKYGYVKLFLNSFEKVDYGSNDIKLIKID